MREPTQSRIADRSREIGSLLEEARYRHGRSVTECAEFLGTSRRRYRAIERGEVPVGAVELELLSEYLEIALSYIQPSRQEGRQVVVQADPGEYVQIVVDVGSSRKDWHGTYAHAVPPGP